LPTPLSFCWYCLWCKNCLEQSAFDVSDCSLGLAQVAVDAVETSRNIAYRSGENVAVVASSQIIELSFQVVLISEQLAFSSNQLDAGRLQLVDDVRVGHAGVSGACQADRVEGEDGRGGEDNFANEVFDCLIHGL
jgi:hypothetical protein